MNPGKQSTLFQTWGKKESKQERNDVKTGRPELQQSSSSIRHGSPEIIDICDGDEEEDEMLARALEESLVYAQATGTADSPHDGKKVPEKNNSKAACQPNTSASDHMDEFSENENFSAVSDMFAADFEPSQSVSQTENIPGFDKVSGQVWIYPINYPLREYQFNIVNKALFKNTLVTLPTGLGKTFIAAVVMYNFYRWYPQGKVVFMAPTKPLVAQQIEACYNIMGIPQEDTAEMTGSMSPAERLKAWNYKRVFFLTPQVLTNDLSRGACPSVNMKCLVIDEAHKALGNHAYCQVVRELVKYTRNFRILALSATPGSDIKAVQQVVANLLVSQIELRTEESIDIQPYVHDRKVVKIVVPLGRELSAIKEKYIRVMDVIVKRLTRQRVLYNRQTTSLSKFMILKAREAFRQNPPPELQRTQYGAIEGDFALAMSLYHGFELLQLHGLKSLHTYLEGLSSGDKGYGRTRTELNKNGDFRDLMDDLHGKFAHTNSDENQTNPFAFSQRLTPNQPFVSGHPKIEKLREVVLQHFEKYKGSSSTRIMIFAQYRDSVTEITDMLSRHRPVVKVMSFIGQSSAGKTTKGFTQKEQLKVMKKFREGGYNTLVSTCVGEEGLDIGDVDLIICFDASKSPIRLVQRMGRTGRKREGSIIMLMTEGKEEQIYNQSQYSKKSIHKAILNGAKSLQFYPHSPRMVPENLQPRCHKMHITVQKAFRSAAKQRAAKAKKAQKNAGMFDQPGKKPHKSDGLLTEDELQYWSENFKLPDSEVPKLHESDFRYFKKKNQPQSLPEDDVVEVAGPYLRLAEWMPWQNRKHTTQVIDHSLDTEHLVEMMEFIDVQQSLGEEDDSYGMEMAAYLKLDDVKCPEKKTSENVGIRKFCSADDTEDNSVFQHIDSKSCQGQVRRIETLPTIACDLTESNSDEELPPFMTSPSCSKAVDTHIDTNKHESLDGMKREMFNDEQSASRLKIRESSTHCEVKQETAVEKLSIDNGAKLSTRINSNILKSGKPKKKREPRTSKTVVEIMLDDDDDNDFDSAPVKERLQVITEETPGGQGEEAMEVDSLASDKKQSKSEEEMKAAIDLESARLSQLLPDVNSCNKAFNSPGFLRGSYERPDKHIATPDHQAKQGYHVSIPSPPPVEEIQKAFSKIGKGSFPKLDLVQVVDEWEREKLEAGLNQSCNKSCEEGQLSGELSGGPVSVPKKCQVSVSFRSVRTSPGYQVDTDDGFSGNTEKMSFRNGHNDTNLVDMAGPQLSVVTCCNNNEYEPSKPIQLCKSKTDCLVEDDVIDDIQVPDKCGAKDEFSPCYDHETENNVAIVESASFQVDETLAVSSVSSEPSSPQDTNLSPTYGLKTEEHPRGANEIDGYDSQGSSDHSPSLLEQDPVYTQDSKLLASAVFVGQEQNSEDYGEWDFTSSDIENDTDAEEESDPPVAELPKSPIIKPSSLPFGRYAESKRTVIPDKPEIVEHVKDSDLDNCFHESDLFLSPVNTPMTASKGSFSRTGKTTPGKTPASGLDESHFTFTQALACLHDSPTPTQAFRAEFLEKSAVNIELGADETCDTKTGIRLLSPTSDSGNSDKGEFDLGFTWDDVDVVPPSPVRDQSICHKPSKCSQSVVFGKRKLSTIDEENITESLHCHVDANSDSQEFDDVLEICFEESFVFPKTKVTDESLARTSGVQQKLSPDSPQSRNLSKVDVPVAPVSPPAMLKNVQELPVPSSPVSPPAMSKNVLELPGSPVFTPQAFFSARDRAQPSPVKPFEFKTPTRSSRMIPTKRQNYNSSRKNLNCSSESEDSPVVLKRKKSRGGAKSRPVGLSPSEEEEEEDAEGDEEEDFADTSIKMHSTHKKKNPTIKQYKKKRSAADCAFIDHEALLSDDGASDVSGDEVDNSQMDSILQDFIYDGSQVFYTSQVSERPDETALYLRSVRSPIVTDRDSVYRRHRRPPPMDVYSQVPEEDYSEYLEDSFCVVGDDGKEEESDENDFGEITCFYPAKKYCKGSLRKRGDQKKRKEKGGVNRKRIISCADSSSEDDADNKQDFSLMMMMTQDVTNKKKKRARIVSSGEEDTHADSRHDQVDVVVHNTLDEEQDELTPPLLSLRSRLQTASCRRETQTSVNLSVIKEDPKVVSGSGHGRLNNDISINGKDLIHTGKKTRDNRASCENSAVEILGSNPLLKKSPDLEREDRLRRQREKQEEFRRKIAEKSRSELSQKGDNSGTCMETVCYVQNEDRNKTLSVDQTNLTLSSSLGENGNSNFTKLLVPVQRQRERDLPSDGCLVTSPLVSRLQEKKITVLVDSREITGGQEVVSCLRVSQQFNVVVRQLTGCDYILSNRLAVERKLWADFANGSHRAKLQERIQQICTLFDRPCLIIERDKVKPGEEKAARPQVRTKYVDMTLAWLAKSSVQIFFTESQEESARLLADLCKLEERKGMAIHVSPDLNSYQEQWLNFFTSLPRISYVNALNLCHGFKNLTELSNSSIKSLQTKGQISESKAKTVREMLQHHFCLAMVPASSVT